MKIENSQQYSFYLHDDKKLQDQDCVLQIRNENPSSKIYYSIVEPSKLPQA